jgi:hypothetical protein
MKDIKEQASAKAFAKLSLAKLELKKTENTDPKDFPDFGTTRDNAIAYQAKQVEVWKYITKLIELDI